MYNTSFSYKTEKKSLHSADNSPFSRYFRVVKISDLNFFLECVFCWLLSRNNWKQLNVKNLACDWTIPTDYLRLETGTYFHHRKSNWKWRWILILYSTGSTPQNHFHSSRLASQKQIFPMVCQKFSCNEIRSANRNKLARYSFCYWSSRSMVATLWLSLR